MTMTRRGFLGGAVATGVMASSGCRNTGLLTRRHDDRLTVFVSDLHVGKEGSYQERRFAEIVSDILSLDPLPRRMVVFGDIAYQSGELSDYRVSEPFFRRIADAGVEIFYGMGNHDRRCGFWASHPEFASRNLLPGKVVSSFSGPDADFLMLDGLQGRDDRAASDMGPVPGAFDADMCTWIRDVLPSWRRPVFVASHYPIRELFVDLEHKVPLAKFLIDSCPNVRGYIHGHDHCWYDMWESNGDWRTLRTVRTLCLPSTGHWGDIGYALFRTTPQEARVELVEKDFFFPRPVQGDEERPREWDRIVADHRGVVCTFAI